MIENVFNVLFFVYVYCLVLRCKKVKLDNY